MADYHYHYHYHYPRHAQTRITRKPATIKIATSASSLLQKHVSNSTQLFGILTLLITGAISLLLTGLTVAVTILGLILFAPLIIVLSPLWVPVFAVLFVITVGFLSTCGFGLLVVAVLSWMFRYLRGLTGHAKDCRWELRSKVIDVAIEVTTKPK